MKKIMFNDKYGLTQAVLEGRKIMTRRIIPIKIIQKYGHNKFNDRTYELIRHCVAYQPGDEVAVAQCYEDAILSVGEEEWNKRHKWYNIKYCCHEAGLHNKMFVRSDLMPYRIRIIGIKVERLQDISEEDVYREGFRKEAVNNGWGNAAWHWEAMLTYMDNLGIYKQIRSDKPKEAFSFLMDKVSGYGTWESNPWVFVYEFELLNS